MFKKRSSKHLRKSFTLMRIPVPLSHPCCLHRAPRSRPPPPVQRTPHSLAHPLIPREQTPPSNKPTPRCDETQPEKEVHRTRRITTPTTTKRHNPQVCSSSKHPTPDVKSFEALVTHANASRSVLLYIATNIGLWVRTSFILSPQVD